MPVGKHIYIVDDDSNDFYLFSEILKEIDNSITLSWFSAYREVVQSMKTTNNLPDLIILSTGIGENGSQASLVEWRKNPLLSNIPIIIYSKVNSNHIPKAGHEPGISEPIITPTVEDLKTKVRAMLAMLK
jgi:response regulator RpfG family c-di-GMP phosphodiesterase